MLVLVLVPVLSGAVDEADGVMVKERGKGEGGEGEGEGEARELGLSVGVTKKFSINGGDGRSNVGLRSR